MNRPSLFRAVLGLIFAPGLGLVFGGFLIFAGLSSPGGGAIAGSVGLVGSIATFFLGAWFAYPVALVVGLPLHAVMWRTGLDRAWHYTVAGGLVGGLSALAVGFTLSGVGASGFAVIGATIGAAFWTIVMAGR